jgi:hypothetical protein
MHGLPNLPAIFCVSAILRWFIPAPVIVVLVAAVLVFADHGVPLAGGNELSGN